MLNMVLSALLILNNDAKVEHSSISAKDLWNFFQYFFNILYLNFYEKDWTIWQIHEIQGFERQ